MKLLDVHHWSACHQNYIAMINELLSNLKFTLFTLLHYLHRLKVRLIINTISFMGGIIVFGSAGIGFFELNVNPHFSHFGDVVYYVITTMSTVGFGDKVTLTQGGRIVTMVIILLSLLLMALFSALMAAFFIEMKLREEMGMNSINTNNHVLIIGWNMKGSDIIRRLQTKDQFKGSEVVILADMDSKPVDSDAVFFVRYSGLLDGNHLDKAAIKSARKIIILADYAVKFGADMFTIAHCLLARKHNPDAQIIVEMLNLLTREYFEASGATDIISIGELGGLMITESCLDGSNEMQTILNKIGR